MVLDLIFLTEESIVQISFDSDEFLCMETVPTCQVTGSLTNLIGDIETDFSIGISVNSDDDPLTGT